MTKATITKACPFCGKVQEVEFPVEGVDKYMDGALIQDAFPELSASQREILMTGICDDCWPIEDASEGPADWEDDDNVY